MGEVLVTIKVHGPSGSMVLEGVPVDTGAIHSMVERPVAERLGIQPEAQGLFRVTGRDVELPLATAILEIQGRRFRVPVILGDQNLVGLTTLETLGFAADPTTQRLIHRRIPLFHAEANLAVA